MQAAANMGGSGLSGGGKAILFMNLGRRDMCLQEAAGSHHLGREGESMRLSSGMPALLACGKNIQHLCSLLVCMLWDFYHSTPTKGSPSSLYFLCFHPCLPEKT